MNVKFNPAHYKDLALTIFFTIVVIVAAIFLMKTGFSRMVFEDEVDKVSVSVMEVTSHKGTMFSPTYISILDTEYNRYRIYEKMFKYLDRDVIENLTFGDKAVLNIYKKQDEEKSYCVVGLTINHKEIISSHKGMELENRKEKGIVIFGSILILVALPLGFMRCKYIFKRTIKS